MTAGRCIRAPGAVGQQGVPQDESAKKVYVPAMSEIPSSLG
ncbi:hypothetical protein ACWCXB_35335 [Streptomyces sp. NPDC001514]